MRKLVIILVFCSGAAFATAMASTGNEQASDSPMISHLKVGERVKLERAASGGYNVNILNDHYIKSFERASRKYVPPTIVDIGPDFIVVKTDRGAKQMIAAHAIDEITQLPDAEGAADEKNAKDKPEK